MKIRTFRLEGANLPTRWAYGYREDDTFSGWTTMPEQYIFETGKGKRELIHLTWDPSNRFHLISPKNSSNGYVGCFKIADVWDKRVGEINIPEKYVCDRKEFYRESEDEEMIPTGVILEDLNLDALKLIADAAPRRATAFEVWGSPEEGKRGVSFIDTKNAQLYQVHRGDWNWV